MTDWADVLDRLCAGELAAHARVTGVIMGLIRRARILDLENQWEDICQDVLATLVRVIQRGGIREPKAFVGYCATVTRHEISRRLEQAGRNRARHSETETDEVCEPTRRDMDPTLMLDLQRSLAALPEKLRSVVRAVYLEGRSYEEAAEELGLPLGTLKRLQTQGLKALREQMEVGA